jgi:hypothetical protein
MGGRIRRMWKGSNQKCIFFIQLPFTNNKLLVHEFWRLFAARLSWSPEYMFTSSSSSLLCVTDNLINIAFVISYINWVSTLRLRQCIRPPPPPPPPTPPPPTTPPPPPPPTHTPPPPPPPRPPPPPPPNPSVD